MAKGPTNGGAGGSSGKSEIIVYAPTGSTVTVQRGDETPKTSSEKNGVWTFKNCDIGTWTVNASLNGQTFTQNVVIQEEGQLMRYEVTATYTKWLYNNGDKCTGITGGWESGLFDANSWLQLMAFEENANGFTMSFKTQKSVAEGWWVSYITKNKIDLTNYKTLYIKATNALVPYDAYSNYCELATLNDRTTPYNGDKAVQLQFDFATGTFSADVSTLTGEHYISISGKGEQYYNATSAGTFSITISEVYMK